MRPLLVLCGSLGLAAGLAATVLLHLLPTPITPVYFAYPESPGGPLPDGFSVFTSLTWWPMLLALPGTGLVLGVLAAEIAHRRGWRLHRDPATGGG